MTGERQRSGRRPPRPRGRWDASILTREDIGYGPARPYEYDYGPEMQEPRERRFRAEGRRREPARPDLGPYQARLRRRTRPDHWIRADVEEALFHDTWVDADRITVEVRDGLVTLIGMLPDRVEVRRALRDLDGIPGITGVHNRLEVEA